MSRWKKYWSRRYLMVAKWREAVKTSPLRQLTVIYLDFSYKRQQTKTPRQVSLVNDDGCVPTVAWVVFTLALSTPVLRAELARTGAPYRIDWRRAPQVSPAEKRRRPGCANGGSCARTSSGPALDAGRQKSNEVQDGDPCTVSKVWCPRPLRISWCL